MLVGIPAVHARKGDSRSSTASAERSPQLRPHPGAPEPVAVRARSYGQVKLASLDQGPHEPPLLARTRHTQVMLRTCGQNVVDGPVRW